MALAKTIKSTSAFGSRVALINGKFRTGLRLFWLCWVGGTTTFHMLVSTEAAEREGRSEAVVYARVGSETNRFHLEGTFGDGDLGYVLLSDDGGPVELTLRNHADTFIWRRGSSNSWTLHVAGNREMPRINQSSTLNPASSRWFALQDALRVHGVEQFPARLDPDALRLLHPERGESFSTHRIVSYGMEMAYFDVTQHGDGSRITNLAGNASIVVKPGGKNSTIELIVASDSCFSSRVFTNVIAEMRAQFTCSYREAARPQHPSVSTNYGMVIDFRTGVRTEYGLPDLTAASWPVKAPPPSAEMNRRSSPIGLMFIGLLLIPGIHLLLKSRRKRQ
jgi:hypothetical protein